MKTISTMIIALFVLQQSYSQNYKTIIPEMISHYGDNLYPIRIDSITNSGDSIFYHNFKMIRDQGDGYFTLHGSSWTGESIIILPDGYNLFVNEDRDTIKINTHAEINEIWQLYKFPDDSYIEAKVTNIEMQTFIGISDSVKTINLQMKDPDGNIIDNEINDKYLKLSKNHGFTRIFNFYEFPFNHENDFLYPIEPEMEIKGFGEYGHQNFGAPEIFGYNLNDERHILEYFYEFDCNKPLCEKLEKYIRKVVNKYVSDNQDTIIYTYDDCGLTIYEGLHGGDWQHQTNETIILSDPKNERLDNLNFQPYYDTSNDNYVVTASNDTAKWIKLIFTGTDINQLSLDFQNQESDDDFYKIYYKGLGGDYFWFYTLCCIDEKKVVYSKRGEDEWGNPYNCADFDEIKEDKNDIINIYPNPTSSTIRLDYGNTKVTKIQIYDLTGRVLFETKEEKDFFDFSNFTTGTYIMSIQTKKAIFTTKIVKI